MRKNRQTSFRGASGPDGGVEGLWIRGLGEQRDLERIGGTIRISKRATREKRAVHVWVCWQCCCAAVEDGGRSQRVQSLTTHAALVKLGCCSLFSPTLMHQHPSSVRLPSLLSNCEFTCRTSTTTCIGFHPSRRRSSRCE